MKNNSCYFSEAFVLRRCYLFVANRHNVRLNGVWRNLIWWQVPLPMAGAWNVMIFKVPSDPKPFCDPLI